MPKLYVVGTPIGNLKDITLRAIDTLKSVDVIACEDTRHSLPLLNRYDVHAKLISYHKFNETQCTETIISLIREGKSVALISDAGMPSISDPGAELISECRNRGIEIELIPGPTALTSAVTLSGIKSRGFTFLGFLPEKNKDKSVILSKVMSAGLPIVLYVAPHDLTKTAAFLYEMLGDRTCYVARELTKLHETLTLTTLGSFVCEERGEIVLIVEGAQTDNPLNELSVSEHLKHYISMGLDKKEAVKSVASDRGVPKNEIYRQALDL